INEAPIDSASTPMTAVSCESTTQCTAVDVGANRVTFNPLQGSAASVLLTNSLTAVTCAASGDCVAVGTGGSATTFTAAGPSFRGRTAAGPARLNGVACPASHECVAVGDNGGEATFDPATQDMPTPAIIDSGEALASISCPAATQCTTVDGLA